MADLSPDRLDSAPPFTNVGIDVFGDFEVKVGKVTPSCDAERIVWVALFTCLSSCVVYLELRDNLYILYSRILFVISLTSWVKYLCLEVKKVRTLWDPETRQST